VLITSVRRLPPTHLNPFPHHNFQHLGAWRRSSPISPSPIQSMAHHARTFSCLHMPHPAHRSLGTLREPQQPFVVGCSACSWETVATTMHVTPRAARPSGPNRGRVEPLPGDRAVHLARRGQRRHATCRPHLPPRCCSLRRRPRPQTVDGAGCAGAGLRILRTPRCRPDHSSQSGPNFRYVISEAGSVWPGRIPPQVSPRHAGSEHPAGP
jgi:hypothetical protein